MLKPLIKIQLNRMDWLLECATMLLLLSSLIIPALNYTLLPNTIPIHFDAAGNVNGYGTKLSIWILPFIAVVVYGALTIMQQYPNKVNYIIAITKENAYRQYRNMLYMIRALKLLVLVVLVYVILTVVQAAKSDLITTTSWFLPITLFSVFGLLIVFLVRSYRMK